MSRRGLVTVGQTLAVLRQRSPGPLTRGSSLGLTLAGAESNVAIGVRRLGLPATWIGHVGADPLGEMVVRELRAEGLDVLVRVDTTRPTALLLSERRTADRTRVWYYRSQSAGVDLAPTDLPQGVIGDAGLLHVTGITLGLGTGPADTTQRAAETASAANVPVSFDINHRAALPDAAAFQDRARRLLPLCDTVFATVPEARLFSNADDLDGLAADLLRVGPRRVILKLGAKGAMSATSSGVLTQAAFGVTAVDPVGAGDAFAAGYLSGMLHGWGEQACLTQAAQVGAIAVATEGDWEGLPMSAELAVLTASTDILR